MEAAAERIKYEYVPVTRIYGSALAEALPGEEKETDEITLPLPRTRVEREAAPAARQKRHIGQRILAVVMIFFFAAVLMLVMYRYTQISANYTEINRLKTEIEDAKESLTALEVQLNSAISLEDARKVAEQAGMRYPEADQIVRIDRDAGD